MPSGHAVETAFGEHMRHEGPAGHGGLLRDVILGGQDGIVNVLGVLLGVAQATRDSRIVLVAGLATTFAESVSMAAVAYTSAKAEKEFYQKELAREKMEMKHFPHIETEEIRQIYKKKGFRGRRLEFIVKAITSNDDAWLMTMMSEELGLPQDRSDPLRSSATVGFSALAGSLVPLWPFFFFAAAEAMAASIATSAVVLFAAGAYKARMTVGDWHIKGLDLAGIGMASALAGYFV